MQKTSNDTDNINKFWTSLEAWHKQSDVVSQYFKSDYKGYESWGECYLVINYDEEYKIQYGEPCHLLGDENAASCVDIEDIKAFIEIMYARWIQTEQDTRYKFTIEINKRFTQFQLPYRLDRGKVVAKGYRTSEKNDVILNYKMFERKIKFSEQMIVNKDILDKKCALDFIVDALQYYISIQDASLVEKKYAEAAKTVNGDANTKVYAVIKNEINEVMKISNEYFDIRHNEYLNKSKAKREALDDLQFIEYLYNRIYALLYLLRLKVKKEKLITEKPLQEN